jgi:hypothetical protein
LGGQIVIVPVTRFCLPDGRQVPDETTISDDCKAKYEEMRAAGCRLTAEILSNGNVTCCIEHREYGDFDISLTENGPEVQAGIETMLRRFTLEAFEAFKAEQEGDEWRSALGLP